MIWQNYTEKKRVGSKGRSRMFMDHKVVVITGAASGLGLELTKSCLQRKMCVVMADIAVSALSEQVHALSALPDAQVLGVVCDVTDTQSLQHLVSETFDCFGHIDWLINNAGISGPIMPVWEQTPEQIQKVLDVNLFGAIQTTQAFLPYMFKQNHRSHVINISSVYGLCSGSFLSAYAMSKQALFAFSESLYFDLARLEKPVDVSVVCPSFVNTPLLANSPPQEESELHELFCKVMTHSRSVEDIAPHIISAIEKNIFYILPDQEVKTYCENRTQAIIMQKTPHRHDLEKMLTTLSKRVVLDEI